MDKLRAVRAATLSRYEGSLAVLNPPQIVRKPYAPTATIARTPRIRNSLQPRIAWLLHRNRQLTAIPFEWTGPPTPNQLDYL